MVEEKQKYRVRVLKRIEITTSPRPGEKVVTMAISYQANDRPVRTIWVDKEKWSLEAEKELVRKDIEEKAEAREVEEYEL